MKLKTMEYIKRPDAKAQGTLKGYVREADEF